MSSWHRVDAASVVCWPACELAETPSAFVSSDPDSDERATGGQRRADTGMHRTGFHRLTVPHRVPTSEQRATTAARVADGSGGVGRALARDRTECDDGCGPAVDAERPEYRLEVLLHRALGDAE